MAITVDTSFTPLGDGIKSAQAATSITLPAVNFAVNDVIVIGIAADNAGTSGVSAYASVDQPSTGAITWEAAQVVNRTAASAANDGTTLIVLVGVVTTQVDGNSTIAVNWSPDVTAKAWLIYRVLGASSTIRTFASATGTGTSPTVTSGSTPVGSVQNGNIVIGLVAVESATATSASDADTLNGSWSGETEGSSAGTGGDATKMSIATQHKIVTADGDQTYNPTATNTDRAIAILGLGPAVAAAPRVPFYRPMTQLLAH